jgi:hypothetical protein
MKNIKSFKSHGTSEALDESFGPKIGYRSSSKIFIEDSEIEKVSKFKTTNDIAKVHTYTYRNIWIS